MNPWRFLGFSWLWDYVSSKIDYAPLLRGRLRPILRLGQERATPLYLQHPARIRNTTVRGTSLRHGGRPKRS